MPKSSMPITKKRKVAPAPAEESETVVPSSPEPSPAPEDQEAAEDNDAEAETEASAPKSFKELGLIDSLCEAWYLSSRLSLRKQSLT